MLHTPLLLAASAAMLCLLGHSQPLDAAHEDGHILVLLQGLQKIPPSQCLKDRKNFHFPCKGHATVQMRNEAATCCYLRMLPQVFSLFRANPRAAWEKEAVDQLLARLAERWKALERSLPGPPFCPELGIAVLKYFQGITSYLKAKEYSPCAWEMVRVEIRASLSRVSGPLRKGSPVS